MVIYPAATVSIRGAYNAVTRYPTLTPAASDHPLRRTRVPQSWASTPGPTWQCHRYATHWFPSSKARSVRPALRPTQRFGGEDVRSKARARLTTPTAPLQTTSRRTLVRPPSPAKTPARRASTTMPRAWEIRRGWQDQSRVSNPNQRLRATRVNSIVPLISAALRRTFDASVDQRPWLGEDRV